jgi:hypothetical protein
VAAVSPLSPTNAERVCAEIMPGKKLERDDDSSGIHRPLG